MAGECGQLVGARDQAVGLQRPSMPTAYFSGLFNWIDRAALIDCKAQV